MYVGSMGEITAAIVGLLDKVEKVDQGVDTPTKDRYYGSK